MLHSLQVSKSYPYAMGNLISMTKINFLYACNYKYLASSSVINSLNFEK